MLTSVLLRPFRPLPAPVAPVAPAPKPARAGRRVTRDDADLSARQAEAARATAAARGARSARVVADAAVLLSAGGPAPTQAAVLAVVMASGVTSERTVRRHWPAALAAVERSRVSPARQPDTACAAPGDSPQSETPQERSAFPSDLCMDLEHIFRDYISRGQTRACIAAAHGLPLADVVALLGPDLVTEED